MKKISKNDLKLDKEVISSLSENELSSVKGGVDGRQKTEGICINTAGCDLPSKKPDCLVSGLPISCECSESIDFCEVSRGCATLLVTCK